jgi:hypothetical protein
MDGDQRSSVINGKVKEDEGSEKSSHEKSPLLSQMSDTKLDEQLMIIDGQPFFKPTFNSKPTKSMRSQPRHPRVSSAYRRARYENRKQVFACCLASFSAFADVLCYHSLGCYGNMMTGNTIKLMDHLAAGRWIQASYPASLVPAYIL